MGNTLYSKNRFKKIDITDIAVKKVRKISYHTLSSEQNDILFDLARIVLLTSKEKNQSNEVAITIDLDNIDNGWGISYGDEHWVDVCSDTISNHLLLTGNNVAIIHNHPSTQTLSIEDIGFFFRYARLKFMVVVTNQGTVHYIMKDDDYSYEDAERLRQECVEDLTKESSVTECYEAALDFITHCSEVGLYYR